MPTADVDTLLAQLRETLKDELREEVRAELIAELAGGKMPSKAATTKGKPGPKPKPKTAAAAKAASKPSALKVKPGHRRTKDEVGEAAKVIMDYVRNNPGSRIDQIAKALGTKVKDLQLPVQMLLDYKDLKKAGKLRGTKYTVKG